MCFGNTFFYFIFRFWYSVYQTLYIWVYFVYTPLGILKLDSEIINNNNVLCYFFAQFRYTAQFKYPKKYFLSPVSLQSPKYNFVVFIKRQWVYCVCFIHISSFIFERIFPLNTRLMLFFNYFPAAYLKVLLIRRVWTGHSFQSTTRRPDKQHFVRKYHISNAYFQNILGKPFLNRYPCVGY